MAQFTTRGLETMRAIDPADPATERVGRFAWVVLTTMFTTIAALLVMAASAPK
jgi:hypothetical protein